MVNKQTQAGFALLMTLIVVSVLVSIGIAVLDITAKQVRLATNDRDSEISFHAANAGIECARFTRRVSASAMENGLPIAPSCFGGAVTTNTFSQITAGVTPPGAQVYKYEYAITWPDNARCTQVTTIILNVPITGSVTTLSGLQNHITGFPTTSTICRPGERCTILASRGYNRPCNQLGVIGTIQREVLLQY